MKIRFEVKESVLILDVIFENDQERGLKLVTAPLPFRVEDLYTDGSKGNFGKVNGERKKIFCLPKHPGTGIPHLTNKTGVRLEEGTTEVGRIKSDEKTLEAWWSQTLSQIRDGKNQQRGFSSEIETYQATESVVNLAAEGGGRAHTRIVF